MDFEVAWPLALALGSVASGATFFLGRRVDAPSSRRRIFLGASAVLSFVSVWPVASTGVLLLVFGGTGYCDDPGAGCVSRWWAAVGVFVLLVALGLVYLMVESVKAYRRIGRRSS